jgi:cell division septal protein FtsQ
VARGDSDNSETPLLLRVLKGAGVAVATMIVGGAMLYGLGVLREGVRSSPSYQVSAESLRLATGPSWMTPEILSELDIMKIDPGFPAHFSLLDEGVSDRIAAAYRQCPWVECVEKIVKHDPRVDARVPPLEVFVKFRRPIAFVQVRDGYRLIDDKGVLLPGGYSEPSLGATPLIVIQGVTTPAPAVGQTWADAGLLAGARVAEAVDPRRETFRLATIDVSNVGGRRDPADSEIALFTAQKTRIKWGKAPGTNAALLLEKTPEEKVAYLDYVYKRLNGEVDGVLAYIDIANETVRSRPTDVVTRVRS